MRYEIDELLILSMNRKPPRDIAAFFVAASAVLLWCVVGVLNVEMGLHIEYSLGTSSGWHSWFTRGAPGEAIRNWGVPIYDQWSGLGYRLPTQGLLSDTPLAYLGLVLPMNFVVAVSWLSSLWFMFTLVHRWVASWVATHRTVWMVLVDSSLLGVMSFYTLWHGWQEYVIQIAGAVVCIVSLTSREIVENPERVRLFAFMANLGIGTSMLMIPHLGYGITFAPVIVLLFAIVTFSNRGALGRRILRRPIVLIAPALTLLALLPGLIDVSRELRIQSARPDYTPEFGVLRYVFDQFANGTVGFDSGNLNHWLLVVLPLAHTFVFPSVAIIRPETYLASSPAAGSIPFWNAYSWPHALTPFHGGILFLVLLAWSVLRPRLKKTAGLEHAIVMAATLSTFIALFNTNTGPFRWLSLSWIPTALLSNSRWQHADLSCVLTMVLLVWRANEIGKLFSHIGSSSGFTRNGLRLFTALGVVVLGSLLPYRVIEAVRLNGGQTRFAPLQIDATTRQSNEQWRPLLVEVQRSLGMNSAGTPQRVLIEGEGFMGAEGDNSWWGLRTHSQLRDVKLASLLSWPRVRSGETLTPSDKLQHIVSDPLCDEHIPQRLDLLSVSWAILPTSCIENYFSGVPATRISDPPSWSNVTANRTRASIMSQMIARESDVDFSATKIERHHHWWAQKDSLSSTVCHILVEDCVKQLQLSQGIQVDSPPLEICERGCAMRYRLGQSPPTGMMLVIPMNHDRTIRALQNGVEHRTYNFHGLVAVEGAELGTGVMEFVIRPDFVMTARSFAPLLLLCLILIAFMTRKCID